MATSVSDIAAICAFLDAKTSQIATIPAGEGRHGPAPAADRRVTRRVKVRPVLHDVLVALKPIDAEPDAYVFATRTGGQQTTRWVWAPVPIPTYRVNRAIVDGPVESRSTSGVQGNTPGRIRTFGLCLRRAALYPLSYGRLEGSV